MQVGRSPGVRLHTPTAAPAAMATPRAVVSDMVGLSGEAHAMLHTDTMTCVCVVLDCKFWSGCVHSEPVAVRSMPVHVSTVGLTTSPCQ